MRMIGAMAAVLVLAACEQAPQQPSAAEVAANEQAADELGRQVAALSPGQRNGVFIRAIRDAGLRCQGVTSAEPAPPPARATWVANCNDGSRHVIAFGANGMAQVTSALPRR